MALHPALPQTSTPENLADYLVKNSVDTFKHKATSVLSPERRSELEHEVSECSQELDILKEVTKDFNDAIKAGTYDEDSDQEGKTVIIPATIGKDKLTKNLDAAVKILREGAENSFIELFTIPWSEEKKMICFDIEGQEWSDRSRDMREDEMNKYGMLFSKDKNESVADEGGEPVEDSGPVVNDGPGDDKEESTDVEEEKVEEPVVESKPKRRGSTGEQKSFI